MKVVDLEEYKSKLELRKQIKMLAKINKEDYESLSPIEQQGYHNFVRLLKAIVTRANDDERDGGH